jgi:hypothetical protein
MFGVGLQTQAKEKWMTNREGGNITTVFAGIILFLVVSLCT